MKISVTVLASVCLATATFAQQPSTTEVKMVCRDLSTGSLAPNEALINGMACRVAGPQADPKIKNIQPKSNSAVTPSNFAESAPNANPMLPASNRITPGATVFIEAQNGFENYLAAAFQKKNVPLVAVASPEQAAYILKATSEEKKAGWAKIVASGQIHSDNAASVQLIDQKTGAIVFAYSVDKKNTLHGQQTTAEACAKHLKEQIEKK
jgi:hypothetical protein